MAEVGFATVGAAGVMGAMAGDAGGMPKVGVVNKNVDRRILIKNKREINWFIWSLLF